MEGYKNGKRLDVFHYLWWLTVTCVCHITISCLPLNETTLLRVSVHIFETNTAGQCPKSVKPIETELLQQKCTEICSAINEIRI